MAQHLLEYHSCIESDFLVLVPCKGGEDDFVLGREVLDGRPSGAYLPAKEVVEYLNDVFAGFEFESVEVEQEVVEEIGVVGFLSELGYDFW